MYKTVWFCQEKDITSAMKKTLLLLPVLLLLAPCSSLAKGHGGDSHHHIGSLDLPEIHFINRYYC